MGLVVDCQLCWIFGEANIIDAGGFGERLFDQLLFFGQFGAQRLEVISQPHENQHVDEHKTGEQEEFVRLKKSNMLDTNF